MPRTSPTLPEPPFRDVAVDVAHRPDGTSILGWPPGRCRIVQGPARPDAPMTQQVPNVVDWLRAWAEARPDTLFMAERGPDGAWQELTYSQAWLKVRRIARQLVRDRGSPREPLPCLAILTPNSARQALLTLAAMHVGIAVSPVSPAYASGDGDPARLRAVFGALAPGLVYTEQPERTRRALAALPLRGAEVIDRDRLDAWAGSGHEDDALVDVFHQEARGPRVAKIMFTSGSTGTPRGVPMSHEMLAAAQATTAAVMSRASAQPQVYLEWLPWHHVMGGNISLHRLLRQGATAYLDAGKPVAALFGTTLANLREIAPTFYFNVPLGYALLVPELERDGALAQRFFSRLESLSFGGSAMPAELVERLQRLSLRLCGRRIAVTSGYGATETCGPGLVTPHTARRAGTLGLPAPGVTAKLVPQGDRYELRLAGTAIAGRYLEDAGGAALDDEGYYRTGDAVQWADEGAPLEGLVFAGRLSEDFKLASGTWVNAGALRQRLLEALSPLASDLALAGENRSALGALVFLDEQACRAHCTAPPASRDALARDPSLKAELARRLDRFNAGASASSMRVTRLMLMAEPPVAEALRATSTSGRCCGAAHRWSRRSTAMLPNRIILTVLS